MATRLPPRRLDRVGLNADLASPCGTILWSRGILLADDRRSSSRTMSGPPSRAKLGVVKTLESVRARLRAVDPFRLDVVVAALFVIATAVDLATIDADGNRAVTIAAGVISVSGLAFRRRDPLLGAVIFVVPALIQAFLDGFYTGDTTVPFVGVILLFYSIGRYAPPKRFPVATAVLAAGMMATLLVEGGLGIEDSFWALFLFGLPTLAGRALRSRMLLQAELREKAELAELERLERARRAVDDERVRIAGELQTLVANGLSTMVVQAEAVPRTIDAGDLAGASTALAAVEETGRDALTEMRRLLGVLRRDEDGPKLAPQPGLARVDALVERGRERGLEVALSVEGARRPLTTGVDLTAYRVIEDALEAATDHGATSAEVLLRYEPEELKLQVSDDREGGASARLPGLSDRVSLYGGHLRAERVDEGFRLRARLPLEEVS
jgi:signal transduction histidine kinase